MIDRGWFTKASDRKNTWYFMLRDICKIMHHKESGGLSNQLHIVSDCEENAREKLSHRLQGYEIIDDPAYME